MTTTLRITCLCRRCEFSAEVPNEELPKETGICHCNSCRHSLGTLFEASIEWPIESFHDAIQSCGQLLTRYSFSSRVDMYFCSTCGSRVFQHTHPRRSTERVTILVGLLQDSAKLIRMGALEFVKDTKDGGASKWISELDNGERLKLLSRGETSEVLPHDWPDHHGNAKTTPSFVSDVLPAQCHCQGVRFDITREKSDKVYMGGGRPENPGPGDEDAGHVIKSSEDNRIKAILCACNSCRLASAADIMPWAFVHKRNIWPVHIGDGEKKSLEQLAPGIGQIQSGELKKYNSSPGVWRYFCGRCGATVFYEGDERPLVPDIAIGLFNAESGALGMDWFRWTADFIRGLDDAKNGNRELVLGADKGLKSWGQRVDVGHQFP